MPITIVLPCPNYTTLLSDLREQNTRQWLPPYSVVAGVKLASQPQEPALTTLVTNIVKKYII